MGRIEKDKNLVRFWLDDKDKPYVLNINTGELLGLMGKPIMRMPPKAATMVDNARWDDGYANIKGLIRCIYNISDFSRKQDEHMKILQMADKLDAVGYHEYYYSDMLNLLSYGEAFDLGKFVKARQENAELDVVSFARQMSIQIWGEKMGLRVSDHLTEAMLHFIHSNYTSQPKEVVSLIAYWLSRGLWDYYPHGQYDMRERINALLRMAKALERKLDKADFFRQYINISREYEMRKDELENKELRLAQEKQIKALTFEDDTFTVIIPMTAKEFADEGEAQHNCVGGYVRTVKEGNRNVVFVRRKTAPHIPCITCDILTDGRINQYLERYNHWISDEDARAFRVAFQAHIYENWVKGE